MLEQCMVHVCRKLIFNKLFSRISLSCECLENKSLVKINRFAVVSHIFQTVSSIIRSYVNILTKDQNFKTWQCKCAEEDISRLSHHVLGVKPNTTPEWETETWDIGQIEAWLPKTHIFLNMFERVWQELFNINSVSIQGPVVRN